MRSHTNSPFHSCFGNDRKKEQHKHFIIRPVAHLSLLPGQSKKGCCGELTDRYYLFSYQRRSKPEETGTFFVGLHCAQTFLDLIGATPLPLFNPLDHLDDDNVPRGGRALTGGVQPPRVRRHPLNKEVFNVINLLCCFWNSPPRSASASILQDLNAAPDQCPESFARSVNTIISKDSQGRTLRAMINEHPNLRVFRFPFINEVLHRLNIPNHIDPHVP